MSKEAMKLALEALNKLADAAGGFSVSGVYFNEGVWEQECLNAAYDAIKALEEALASEQEQRSDSEQLGEPVAWRYKPVRENNPRWEYTTQHPLDMGDGYLRPSLVEYCKCIEPLYATEKPKLMLEKFREMKDLLEDTVQHEPATKEQIREAIVFNLPLYTAPQPAQKPLTDEQIMAALKLKSCDGYRAIVRAIEAAHGIKEKNNG